MGKDLKNSNRLLWFLVGVIAIWIISLPWICKGESNVHEKFGFDLQAGTDVICPGNYSSERWVNTVERASIRYETNDLLWKPLWLGVEGVWSKHKAHSKTIPGFDAGFHDIGGNLTVRYQPFENWPYIGALAGVSYWHNRDHGGHFGDSHWLGTFGGMVGKDWKILETPWSIRTEVRFTHTSDPFGPDPDDMELLSGIIGVGYNF